MNKKVSGLVFCFVVSAQAAAGSLAANVHWARTAALATPVSGVIAQVSVEEGARVNKDQVLLALEDAPFKAAVLEAQAQLTQARVTRDEAKRDNAQAEELYQRTVLSTVELENAKNKFARAQAGYQLAQAQLAQAQYQLRFSVVRAPFAGVVVTRNAEPGQIVAAGLEPPTLIVLAVPGAYNAQAQATGAQVAGLKIGQALKVNVGGRSFNGKLKSLAADNTRNGEAKINVVASFDAGDAAMGAGEAATIEW